jgi:hypothetical protein
MPNICAIGLGWQVAGEMRFDHEIEYKTCACPSELRLAIAPACFNFAAQS